MLNYRHQVVRSGSVSLEPTENLVGEKKAHTDGGADVIFGLVTHLIHETSTLLEKFQL